MKIRKIYHGIRINVFVFVFRYSFFIEMAHVNTCVPMYQFESLDVDFGNNNKSFYNFFFHSQDHLHLFVLFCCFCIFLAFFRMFLNIINKKDTNTLLSEKFLNERTH